MTCRNKVAGQLANFKQQHLNPVKVVADQNNESEKTIHSILKKHFGYSAKKLSRYKRFLKAVELIQQLASITYVNLSPCRYLKFQQDIGNLIS